MTTSRFVNISTLFLVIAAFGPAPAKSQSAPPAAPVSAHDVPARSIRIVGPFRPAGFPDRIARVLAAEMRQTQRVFVENRPGAGGMIGAAEVARAAPDGTALVITTMPALLIAPLVNPRPDFRPIEDFSHIAYIGGPPTAFVVASTSKIQSFADLVRVAKENPQSGIGW